jgi:hypothetical protein
MVEKINAAEQLAGLVAVANGGTGVSTLTGIPKASGTSAFVAATPGTDYSTPSATETLTNKIIPTLIGTPVVNSASSLTLTNSDSMYVFTGSSATTWTLPAVSGNTGVFLILENRGSAAITVAPAGSDHIWFLSSLTSFTIAAGGSLYLMNDGIYWNTLSLDLVNNSVGVLPVASGGSGASTLTGLVKGSGTSAMTAVTAPTGTVVGTTDTMTLTNKRITKRVSTTSAPGATPSMDTDNDDIFIFTGLAVAITSMTTNLTGTPNDGDQLLIRFTDNATARAITWGAKFGSSGVATLLATTVISKVHTVGLIWDATKSLWICLAVDAAGY